MGVGCNISADMEVMNLRTTLDVRTRLSLRIDLGLLLLSCP